MKKLIIIISATISLLMTSCSFSHTCPTYIGAAAPNHYHAIHHPHH